MPKKQEQRMDHAFAADATINHTRQGKTWGIFFGILFKVLRAGIQTCITNYVYILQPQH